MFPKTESQHREQTSQGRQGIGKDGGGWDQQMQAIIYRMGKQQGPIVQHRELYSVFCDKS